MENDKQYFRRTCIFHVEMIAENSNVKRFMDNTAILKWYEKLTENFGEYHDIHQISFMQGPKQDLFCVSFVYQNPDPDWDEGKMCAELLIDPDDDGNYPVNGCLVRGRINTLYEPEKVTYPFYSIESSIEY